MHSRNRATDLAMEASAGSLRRDAGWRLGEAAEVGVKVAQRWRTRQRFLREQSFWTLMFALAPMGFLSLHSHPWAYMLVLPVPFLCLLIADLLNPPLQRATSIPLLGGVVLEECPWMLHTDRLKMLPKR